MRKNVEVEIRSFINKQKYLDLIKFLKKKAKFLEQEKQLTYYFSGPADLRIQKSDNYAKVWLKGGKLHANAREEVEIKVDKKDFSKLKNLFLTLGYKIEIAWDRTRNNFEWQGCDIAVDFTRGYGYILEVEKLTTSNQAGKALGQVKDVFKRLKVLPTPKKDFETKFEWYKKNWKKFVKLK